MDIQVNELKEFEKYMKKHGLVIISATYSAGNDGYSRAHIKFGNPEEAVLPVEDGE